MSEHQRYEYRTVDLTASDFQNGDPEATLNDLASEGWQVVDACIAHGTTVGYVLERPLDA